MVISCLCFLFFFWGEIPPSTKGTRWIRTSFTANSYTFGDLKLNEQQIQLLFWIHCIIFTLFYAMKNLDKNIQYERGHIWEAAMFMLLHGFSTFPEDTSQADKLPSLCFLSKVHLTCLQFFVPISRAMEQKLLKYVPCNTLNSDSSAPLHWTTEDSCSVTSSSPGRNLVGVWQREFPSVIRTYDKKNKKKILTTVDSFRGKKDIRYSYILQTTAHLSHLF